MIILYAQLTAQSFSEDTGCRTDIAYASLKNVQTCKKTNPMQSFFFAGTLKYAYLIFAPENALDLKKIVFEYRSPSI